MKMQNLLSARDLYVDHAVRPQFEALRQQILRDIQPVNALQAEFTNALLRAAWQSRRCDLAERLLAEELGRDPLLCHDPRYSRIQRERSAAHREMRLALAELKKLQTDAAIRRLEANAGLRALPVPIDSRALAREAKAARGLRPHQALTFAPYQQTLDAEAARRGLGQNLWEAWVKHQAEDTVHQKLHHSAN